MEAATGWRPLSGGAGKVDVQLLMRAVAYHRAGLVRLWSGSAPSRRHHPDLRTLWVAPGPPITAAFVPWRIGVEAVPPEYRRHRYLTAGEADRSSVQKEEQGCGIHSLCESCREASPVLMDEHRDSFLPEVRAALAAFDTRQLAAQPDVERTALILLKAKEDALARRYLTEQAPMAAGDGLRLIEALAEGIEARTKWIHGIRPSESDASSRSQ